MHTPLSRRAAYALLFVVPALFASNMITARWLNGTIPPVALAFWRWSGTLALLLIIVGRDAWAQRAAIAREWPTLLLLGSLGMGICGAPVYMAAETTTATNIGLIYAASPVLIIVFAATFWDERLSLVQSGGVALCLGGVLVVVMRGNVATLTHLAFTKGDLLSLGAAISWAVYSVLLRHRPSALHVETRFAAITAGGVVVTAPFYGLEIALGQTAAFDLKTVGVIAFLSLVPGYGAYSLYGKLTESLGASRTGLLMYLIPLYNAGLAGMLIGEQLSLFHLVGLALIFPGLYLANRSTRPSRDPLSASS